MRRCMICKIKISIWYIRRAPHGQLWSSLYFHCGRVEPQSLYFIYTCTSWLDYHQGWHFDPLSFWVFVQKPKNPRPTPPPHLGRYLCITQKPLTENENPFLLHSKVQKSINFYQKPKKPKKPKTQNPKPQSHDPSKMRFFGVFATPADSQTVVLWLVLGLVLNDSSSSYTSKIRYRVR